MITGSAIQEALKGRRALVVDDDSTFGERLASGLKLYGMSEAVAVTDCDAATAAATEDPYDIAIIDLYLPQRSGDKGTQMLGEPLASNFANEFPAMRLLAMSAFARGVPEPTEHLFAGFLSKPDLHGRNGLRLLAERAADTLEESQGPRFFIVHGHDNALLEIVREICRELTQREPVVLRDQANSGATIIEKFESYARRSDLVVALFTPDDDGPGDRRARQNVVFETGFFFGKLQRTSGRVLIVFRGDLEIPSDISGLVYIDGSGSPDQLRAQIQTELAASGL